MALQSSDRLHALPDSPDLAIAAVVRWRRIDLKRVIEERFGVDYHERRIRMLLRQIGSARGRTIPLKMRA